MVFLSDLIAVPLTPIDGAKPLVDCSLGNVVYSCGYPPGVQLPQASMTAASAQSGAFVCAKQSHSARVLYFFWIRQFWLFSAQNVFVCVFFVVVTQHEAFLVFAFSVLL